jgi:transcriptional regulator with XRE-family HTH domain
MSAGWLTSAMVLKTAFGTLCRDNRVRLRLTQRQLGDAVGVSRGHIANIEIGRANPPLDLVDRIAQALDIEISLVARPAIVLGGGQKDLVHARCSGFVDRRMRGDGWLTAREVEVVHGRSHGWIDLLAFDPRSGTLLVIEIKTRLDDVGSIERQLGWYERSAFDVARGLGWGARRIIGWLLVLASDEVEMVLRASRDVFALSFPIRARAMANMVVGVEASAGGRGLGLIDPASHRRQWIIASRIDGRRSSAPYHNHADAARRLAA